MGGGRLLQVVSQLLPEVTRPLFFHGGRKMSGDWIKMRMELQTHPKVVRMSSALNADTFRIIGGLHAAWSLFDTQTDDGLMPGVTCSSLDFLIRWTGFSSAMVAVGWLVETPEGLEMPRFRSHNGKSAKRRAMDTERKSVSRMSACDADKSRTESGLEKRREEKIENTSIPPKVEDAPITSRKESKEPGTEKSDPIKAEFDTAWPTIRESIATPTRRNRDSASKAWAKRRKAGLSSQEIMAWWNDRIVAGASRPELVPAFDAGKQWPDASEIRASLTGPLGESSAPVVSDDRLKRHIEKIQAQQQVRV